MRRLPYGRYVERRINGRPILTGSIAGHPVALMETGIPMVVDMESAGVAQVAFANAVPFIALRNVSDLVGGDAGANRMLAFMALAAGNAAVLVVAFLQEFDRLGPIN
jgi:nucleoside phosphorylase